MLSSKQSSLALLMIQGFRFLYAIDKMSVLNAIFLISSANHKLCVQIRIASVVCIS